MATPRYDKYMVKATRPERRGVPLILMSNKLVPDSNVSIMLNWIREQPKPNPIHAAMESHRYDEIIFNIGADPHHPEDLGAEIEGYLGDEKHLMNATTALYVPRHLAHGGVLWKSFARPHLQVVVKFTGEMEAGPPKPGGKKPPLRPSTRHRYDKYIISKPVRPPMGNLKSTGRTSPPLVYMSNELVPGCNVYVEYTWIWEMPTPNPIDLRHSHDYDEVVMNIGSDPENPDYLGAEIVAYEGGEKQVADKTCAVFLPRNVEHGPVTWTKFERPNIQLGIVIGTGDREKAMPGGHKAPG